MTAASNSEARKRLIEAQSRAECPLSQPIPAPVDSGAIGRLSEEEIGTLLCRCGVELCPVHDENADGYVEHRVDDLIDALNELVRKHTERALAEVERRIEARRAEPADRFGRASRIPFGAGMSEALAIVRAARKEQGR